MESQDIISLLEEPGRKVELQDIISPSEEPDLKVSTATSRNNNRTLVDISPTITSSHTLATATAKSQLLSTVPQ